MQGEKIIRQEKKAMKKAQSGKGRGGAEGKGD